MHAGACSDFRSALSLGTSGVDEAKALLAEAEAGLAMSSCPNPEAKGRGEGATAGTELAASWWCCTACYVPPLPISIVGPSHLILSLGTRTSTLLAFALRFFPPCFLLPISPMLFLPCCGSLSWWEMERSSPCSRVLWLTSKNRRVRIVVHSPGPLSAEARALPAAPSPASTRGDRLCQGKKYI